MTPAQIQNLKETIEDNLDYLDGYDELGPELQGKVERALKEGHVDDSDWCGVCVEQSYKAMGMLTSPRTWTKIVLGRREFVFRPQRRSR